MDDRFAWKMLLAAIFGLAVFAVPAMARSGELRNVHWGMSRFDVMANEELSPETFDAFHVHYKTELEGREQDLVYGFFENMLVDAVYVITILAPDEYQLFRKNLERRYGRPVSNAGRGKGEFMYVWENKDTRIILRPGRLKECRIEYISKKYKYLKDRASRAALERQDRERDWAY